MKIINIIRQTAAAALFLAAISFAGCDKDNDGDEPEDGKTSEMSMTLNVKGEIHISMSGTVTVTIDWGDGSVPETHTLSPYGGNAFTPAQTFYHVYDNYYTRHIIITGKNITHLDNTVSGFQNYYYSNLDVSKNPALTYLKFRGGYNGAVFQGLQNLDVSKNTESNIWMALVTS